jgi:putative DNA primase/helicase
MILERRILVGLITSAAYLKRVAPIWRQDLLESNEMRTLARWCLDHWERYQRPPDRDIEQVYMTAIREEAISKASAEIIEGTLQSISDEHGRGEQFNAAYLFDETVALFKKMALTQHNEAVADLIERGKLDEAEQLAADYSPFVVAAEDSLASVTPRPVAWLWPNRIPLGKLTIVAGPPDLGKSTVLLDITARVSSGTSWPDGHHARKRAVLIASAEDDFEDTVIPRLMAAGADLNLCHEIGRDAADIAALCGEIERKITALRDNGQIVGLVVIDPMSSYLGKVDAHNEGAVRVALRPLGVAAGRHRVTVIALRHTRKAGSGGSAMDQVSGSLAFIAAARAAFLITPDREDDDKRLFLPLKSNLAPTKTGLAYRIVGADVPLRARHGVVKTSVPRIEWLSETVSMSADEAMEAARERHTKIDDVKDWLTDILADGPLPMRTVEEAAGRAGHAMRTVNRAADALGVVKGKGGFQGAWQWSIPMRH